jgi:hypothetical protein
MSADGQSFRHLAVSSRFRITPIDHHGCGLRSEHSRLFGGSYIGLEFAQMYRRFARK